MVPIKADWPKIIGIVVYTIGLSAFILGLIFNIFWVFALGVSVIVTLLVWTIAIGIYNLK